MTEKKKKKPKKEEPISGSDLQLEQLQKAQKELAEFKEKYFLSIAELENMRKRLQREKTEMTKFAAENIILDFLAPIDSFEQALSFTDQMSDETKNWAQGFNMLLNQFKDVLTQNGITPFNCQGKAFDPELHEAVEVEETTKTAEGTIVQEFQCGYKRGDRIIRHARVKVAKKPAEAKTNQTGEKV